MCVDDSFALPTPAQALDLRALCSCPCVQLVFDDSLSLPSPALLLDLCLLFPHLYLQLVSTSRPTKAPYIISYNAQDFSGNIAQTVWRLVGVAS
jgi:hypothetical protein